MKHYNILAALLALMLSTTLSAQQTAHGPHGVRPDADGKKVRKELTGKGARYLETAGDTVRLTNSFAGRDCVVEFPAKCRNPYEAWITVTFPDQQTWKAVAEEYDTVEKALTELYGTPTESRKEFQNETVMHMRPNRMQDLLDGYYTWYTHWDGPDGYARLSIQSATDTTRVFNTITYQIH